MKNYYKTLGVLDDAEDIVIRAAYKALAQRYHPDKWQGNPQIANQRMSDINEAYEILSDPVNRKKYDQEYFSFNSRNDAENTNNEAYDDTTNEEVEGWELAIEFFPNLKNQYDDLKKISIILANTFRASILENKNFKESQLIKDSFERVYLTRYYGEVEDIRNFAKRLLRNGHFQAALKLNKVITVMGNNVDSSSIKRKIYKDYPDANPLEDISLKNSITAFNSNNYNASDLIYIIQYEHSTQVESMDFNSKFTVTVDGKKYEKIEITTLYLLAKNAVYAITGTNYN
jgi:curved DNA-binding protein CbpA